MDVPTGKEGLFQMKESEENRSKNTMCNPNIESETWKLETDVHFVPVVHPRPMCFVYVKL